MVDFRPPSRSCHVSCCHRRLKRSHSQLASKIETGLGRVLSPSIGSYWSGATHSCPQPTQSYPVIRRPQSL